MSLLAGDVRSPSTPVAGPALARVAGRALPVAAAGGLLASAVLVAAASWWSIIVLGPTLVVCAAANALRLG